VANFIQQAKVLAFVVIKFVQEVTIGAVGYGHLDCVLTLANSVTGVLKHLFFISTLQIAPDQTDKRSNIHSQREDYHAHNDNGEGGGHRSTLRLRLEMWSGDLAEIFPAIEAWADRRSASRRAAALCA